MLYYLGGFLKEFWGPARLLQSNAVLIVLAVYIGFLLTKFLLPKFFTKLPQDRGREFTPGKEAAVGKPTGSGVVFITIYVFVCFLICPMNFLQWGTLLLTWFMMLTGYLDDRSEKGWGEYLKGALDLLIAVAETALLVYFMSKDSADGKLYFWFPFVSKMVNIPVWVYCIVSIVVLWFSVNTTNCSDGVDGLSSSLVLIDLLTMGIIFYLILGHVDISTYLLVPHLNDGASWAIMIFALAGILMGYLWHNAFPSKVLMGDAGSRAMGFFTGVLLLVSGNPLLFIATSSIIFLNGGGGLLKVALKRFLHISIFENVRFPLHDHMRKNKGWSPTQVLIKFVIMQLLITVLGLGIMFKVR